MKEKTVCFSGHRPEKLPGMGKESFQLTKDIKSLIYYHIYESINEGYTCFMTGLARGIDIWAGVIIAEFKQNNPGIKLIAVKPFENHSYSFKENELYDLDFILENADEIICTSKEYSKDVYSIRNRYMVEHSSKLIAFVNNYRSGTGQTIRYARNSGLKVNIIDLKELYEKYLQALEKNCDFSYNNI